MITIIYGERCVEIVKYVSQTNKIVPFLRTIKILNFSMPHSECKSSDICIMQYCAMYCKQYDAPVCSRQGDNKYRLNKGFGYNTYTKLYHSGVIPMLDYCSSVWGYCNLDKIDTVQNRTLRLFLGVHKFAHNLSINADMGWIPSKIRRHTEILKMCNRLVKMEDNRLTKKVFFWDKTFSRFSWCSDIHTIFNEL